MGLLDGWRSQVEKRPDGSWRISLFDGEAHRATAVQYFARAYGRSEIIAKAFDLWPYAEIYLVDGEGQSRPFDPFVDLL